LLSLLFSGLEPALTLSFLSSLLFGTIGLFVGQEMAKDTKADYDTENGHQVAQEGGNCTGDLIYEEQNKHTSYNIASLGKGEEMEESYGVAEKGLEKGQRSHGPCPAESWPGNLLLDWLLWFCRLFALGSLCSSSSSYYCNLSLYRVL
jgi:hypothetical protein